jgi:hypothetical protein
LENILFNIRKIESEIKKDDSDIIFNDNYIKISTVFFDNIKSTIYIYPLNNDQNDDALNYTTYNNQLINHPFYDIFPIKKSNFEEFNISVPNKIDKVLESYNFNLNYIVFTKKKKDNKKIIEEVENKNTINAIKENLSNFISVIKPFFFS